MVPLTPDTIVSSRLRSLQQRVHEGIAAAPLQSQGFARLILQRSKYGIEDSWHLSSSGYGGVPEAAHLGYCTAAGIEEAAGGFRAAWERLENRPRGSLVEEFRSDDISVLGLALGIHNSTPDESEWFLELCGPARSTAWTGRARELAYELLKPEGRLKSLPELDPQDSLCLELVMREMWPAYFSGSPAIGSSVRQTTAEQLVVGQPPLAGQIDRVAVQLRALELLVSGLAREAVPTIDKTVGLLKRTETSFARWVWEQNSQRRGLPPVRWIIDRETHVQAFLWAILRPVFGPDLIEEEYLPSYGLKQSKADFGILSLKLLIEVKYLRAPGDLKKTEDEIGGDLGSYFQATDRFNRLVVYVYDDRDEPEREKNDLLRQALLARDDRIVDVIFVRRPSLIPDRDSRGTAQ